MVAVTYGVARVGAKSRRKTAKAAAKTPRKNWFERFLDAMIESRMQSARREIAKHSHLLNNSDTSRGGW